MHVAAVHVCHDAKPILLVIRVDGFLAVADYDALNCVCTQEKSSVLVLVMPMNTTFSNTN